MITVDGTAQAAIDANMRGVAILVELDFSTGTQRFTTWPVDIGTSPVYTAIGALVSINGLSESEDRSAKKVEFSFTIVSQAMLAACIGQANVYRNRRARIYQQFMSSTYTAAGASVLRWQGFMDNVTIERTSSSDLNSGGGAGVGKIKLHCSRAGVPMSRRAIGLRSTHQQQIARHPGDNGFEYQQKLLEQPSVWLFKEFMAQ